MTTHRQGNPEGLETIETFADVSMECVIFIYFYLFYYENRSTKASQGTEDEQNNLIWQNRHKKQNKNI